MSEGEFNFKNLSVPKLAEHVQRITDLYLNPISTYRQVISYRHHTSNLILYHLYYYSVAILILSESCSKAFLLVFGEIVSTLFMVLAFTPAFLLFRRMCKKRIRWNRLYRLFLVIKIQFFLPLLGLLIIGQRFDIPEFIGFVEEIIWVIYLLFIILMPLLLSINWRQRLLWLISNYLSSILFFGIVGYTISVSKPIGNFFKSVSLPSGRTEWRYFTIDKLRIGFEIVDEKYYCVFYSKDPNGELIAIERTQFVSNELFLSHMKTSSNKSKQKQINLLNELLNSPVLPKEDSAKYSEQLIEVQDSFYDSIGYHEITLDRLDTFRLEHTAKFDACKELATSYRDSSQFEFNKELFGAYHDYLEAYEYSYTKPEIINKILENAESIDYFEIDSNFVAAVLKVDTLFYNPERDNWLSMQQEAEKMYDFPFVAKWLYVEPMLFIIVKVPLFLVDLIYLLPEKREEQILERIDKVLGIE